MLLHLNQIQHSLNDSEDRYAELRDNDDDDDDVSFAGYGLVFVFSNSQM